MEAPRDPPHHETTSLAGSTNVTSGVAVRRGGVLESFHRIHASVTDSSGASVASAGDPARVTFLRSSAKPFQALPLVEEGIADRYGLTDQELAICCASHASEPEHLEHVLSVLGRVGLGAGELECGAHPPTQEGEARKMIRKGVAFTSLHNNCSGKHAGMLALAMGMGWPIRGYTAPSHPVQRRMAAEVSRWAEVPEEEIPVGTDGCGVVTFALPLGRMARAFARLAEAAEAGVPGPARIVRSMVEHPFLVAGTDRLDTDLMEVAGDRLFVKSGAEGVVCAGLPSRGLGIALKVEDGGRRGAAPALLELLERLDVLTGSETAGLSTDSRVLVTDTRGHTVGALEVELRLHER